MSAITQAVFDRLNNDDYLGSRLIEPFDGIFTQTPLPDSIDPREDYPYIVTEGNAVDDTDGSADSKTTIGREITRDIRVYQHVHSDSAELEDMAEHIFEMFHEEPLEVDGYDTLLTRASGPTIAPTTRDYVRGRVITLNIQIYKE